MTTINMESMCHYSSPRILYNLKGYIIMGIGVLSLSLSLSHIHTHIYTHTNTNELKNFKWQ